MLSEYEANLDTPLENDIQSNLYISKDYEIKKEQYGNLLDPQNFGPIINIQNPILNINNKQKKIKSILKKKS